MGRLHGGRALAALTGAAIVASAASTRAAGASSDAKQACIDSNTQAQIDQRSGRLRDARRRLVLCASDACPAVVRADCARLLSDVTQSTPSVVVDARDASGSETTRVRVFADGARVAERLDGLEIELDPGEHKLRFEAANGSRPQAVREQTIVLSVGEKRRRILVDFGESAAQGPSDNGADRVAQERSSTETKESPGNHSLVPWLLVAGGTVGLAVFGTFGALGYAKEKQLASGADSCAPRCTSGELAPVRTDYALSDVGIGVGLAALGGGLVYFLLTRASASSSAAALPFDVQTARDGARVLARLRW